MSSSRNVVGDAVADCRLYLSRDSHALEDRLAGWPWPGSRSAWPGRPAAQPFDRAPAARCSRQSTSNERFRRVCLGEGRLSAKVLSRAFGAVRRQGGAMSGSSAEEGAALVAACTATAAHRRDHHHPLSTSCHPHVVEVVHLGHRAVVVCHDCEADSGFLPEREANAVAAAHRVATVGGGSPALGPAA